MAFLCVPGFSEDRRAAFLSAGAHGNMSSQHLPEYAHSHLPSLPRIMHIFSLEANQSHGIRKFSTSDLPGSAKSDDPPVATFWKFHGPGKSGKWVVFSSPNVFFSRFCCISFHFSLQSALTGKTGANTVMRRGL